MVVPQGYDLKALEPTGHLLAVDGILTNIDFTILLDVGGLLPVICGENFVFLGLQFGVSSFFIF
ncbi:hypothetical protein [uncultured Virgibacillus sp.]|uniref:hypothetical protein n=1 Tax=uncultured Virgibacillus sp. TaxID=417355 RepID=UPI0026395288|nr:hypothetical protein [uncultured Virgibacillus sp.]